MEITPPVWMAKSDAADRQASGEPVPEGIQRLLGNLTAPAKSSGEVLDIYDASGMPKPSLDDLTPEFIAKTQKARNPQLAMEASRRLIANESAYSTRNNVIRQRAFSEVITELMKKYTNEQLRSAEVIAELVELAREVAAEGKRGQQFTLPLNSDEPAFYDTAKLRSSIKRMPVINGYPPDKPPETIKLVMEQMESMAPRFVEARA